MQHVCYITHVTFSCYILVKYFRNERISGISPVWLEIKKTVWACYIINIQKCKFPALWLLLSADMIYGMFGISISWYSFLLDNDPFSGSNSRQPFWSRIARPLENSNSYQIGCKETISSWLDCMVWNKFQAIFC